MILRLIKLMCCNIGLPDLEGLSPETTKAILDNYFSGI